MGVAQVAAPDQPLPIDLPMQTRDQAPSSLVSAGRAYQPNASPEASHIVRRVAGAAGHDLGRNRTRGSARAPREIRAQCVQR